MDWSESIRAASDAASQKVKGEPLFGAPITVGQKTVVPVSVVRVTTTVAAGDAAAVEVSAEHEAQGYLQEQDGAVVFTSIVPETAASTPAEVIELLQQIVGELQAGGEAGEPSPGPGADEPGDYPGRPREPGVGGHGPRPPAGRGGPAGGRRNERPSPGGCSGPRQGDGPPWRGHGPLDILIWLGHKLCGLGGRR